MTSKCDSLAAEINVILRLLQATCENEAMRYKKGQFADVIVQFLEMRWKHQAWERRPPVLLETNGGPRRPGTAKSPKGCRGQGTKKKGMVTCPDGWRARKLAPHTACPLSHNPSRVSQLLGTFSVFSLTLLITPLSNQRL